MSLYIILLDGNNKHILSWVEFELNNGGAGDVYHILVKQKYCTKTNLSYVQLSFAEIT